MQYRCYRYLNQSFYALWQQLPHVGLLETQMLFVGHDRQILFWFWIFLIFLYNELLKWRSLLLTKILRSEICHHKWFEPSMGIGLLLLVFHRQCDFLHSKIHNLKINNRYVIHLLIKAHSVKGKRSRQRSRRREITQTHAKWFCKQGRERLCC